MLLKNSRYLTVGTSIGGANVLSNKFKIKEEEWFGVTRISEYAGYPQGYGGKSFAMPLSAGAMSALNEVTFETSGNMANGSLSFMVDTNADLYAIAQLNATTNINITTQSSIIGALDLIVNDFVSISSSGELSSVLEAFASDYVAISSSGELVGITELMANDTISVNSNASMIGAFEGSSTTTISVNMSSNALFGQGYTSAQLTTLLFTNTGTLTAVGFMGGTTESDSGVLTPAQIWAYNNRTLTDFNIGDVTVDVDYDAIADAVWSKEL